MLKKNVSIWESGLGYLDVHKFIMSLATHESNFYAPFPDMLRFSEHNVKES